jgi:hypothetical protein
MKTMEIKNLQIRMEALRNQIRNWLSDNKDRHMPLALADRLLVEYSSLKRNLEDTGNELLANLPFNADLKTESSGTFVLRNEISQLVSDIQFCLDLLPNISSLEVPWMKITKEGIFFAGQYFDAFQRITEIFQEAKQNIYIIDGYINTSFLNFFVTKGDSVFIEIMTKSHSNNPNLINAAAAFNKQYKNLSIRVSENFHDRFIIIDEKNFYHLGASIKDAGNKGFMFSVIEEPIITKALLNEYKKEWSGATIIV